jgi:hypothetical protein
MLSDLTPDKRGQTTMTRTIDNAEDVIDSRDVIERIETIREMLPQSGLDAWTSSIDEEQETELRSELASLEKLAKQGEDYASDWEHGETLIRYSYFTEYVREMLEDCGDIPKNIPHYIEIDWEATARNVMVDYTHIDFDGVTYLIR